MLTFATIDFAMNCLGLRFSNKDFAYALIGGSFDNPLIVDSGIEKLPKNFSRCRSLLWLHLELDSLIKKLKPNSIFLKGMEPAANKNNSAALERIENEAIAYLVAGQNGIDLIDRVVDATVAARLKVGQKDKRRLCYESCQVAFGDAFDEKEKDAILSAWIKLP